MFFPVCDPADVVSIVFKRPLIHVVQDERCTGFCKRSTWLCETQVSKSRRCLVILGSHPQLVHSSWQFQLHIKVKIDIITNINIVIMIKQKTFKLVIQDLFRNTVVKRTNVDTYLTKQDHQVPIEPIIKMPLEGDKAFVVPCPSYKDKESNFHNKMKLSSNVLSSNQPTEFICLKINYLIRK